MKTIIALLCLASAATTLTAQVATTNSFSLNPNAAITDGSPVGLSEQFNVSGVAGTISEVTVTLDITGGFNGDLYAYLVGPQGQLAVLLNRPGITADNAFGYDNTGLNITLDDSATTAAANIHDYGSGAYNLNGSGQVTGTWASDGRAIDPQSAGTIFDSAATTANLSLFQNTDPNGTWTFFVADLSTGGGTANLNQIGLNIMSVPEPQTWAILGGGLAMLGLSWNRTRFRK